MEADTGTEQIRFAHQVAPDEQYAPLSPCPFDFRASQEYSPSTPWKRPKSPTMSPRTAMWTSCHVSQVNTRAHVRWASPLAILTRYHHHMLTQSHTYFRWLLRFVDSNFTPSSTDGVMWLILSLFFFSLDSDDYNRVQLTTGNGSTGCDYINASFIDVQQTQTHIQTFCAVDPQLRTFWVDQGWGSWSIFDVTCFLITGVQGIQKVHSSSR